jgi:hypothetical protein
LSNPDSFIDEVTEEVRRDRLFAAFRRYGWIGVVLVVLIVGGAAFNEWQKARAEARAEAFGDAVLDAQDLGDPADRTATIAAIPADGGQLAIQKLLLAADPTGDREGTISALTALSADASQPQIYRDLATLRLVLISGAWMPLAERRTALEAMAASGRPFRLLAQEQLAYLLIEEGQADAAIAALASLVQDQAAPSGLRSRASQMITALGGTVPGTAATTDQG